MGNLLAHVAIQWVNQSAAGQSVISSLHDSKVFHAFYKSVPLKNMAKLFYCFTLNVT